MGEKKRRDEIRKKSADEIHEHFRGQWNALVSSSLNYDKGALWELPRMASALSIFLHDGQQFSLLSLADLKSKIKLWDTTGRFIDGRNLMADHPLVAISLGPHGFGYSVSLDDSPGSGWESANEWWERIPVARFPENDTRYTRKDIIQVVRNTEGGGHVDPGIRDLTDRLGARSKELWTSSAGQPVQSTILACSIRQIAHEFIRSIEKSAPESIDGCVAYPNSMRPMTQQLNASA